MKLTEKEKQLRDEIAKDLFIHSEIGDPYECFETAHSFIHAQREKHKKDIIDYSTYKGTLTNRFDGDYWDGLPG